jgi:hypothetical protein
MDSASSLMGLIGTASAAVMWLVHTLRHRRHLSQCVQDLQRHRRLDRRLVGCVNEMEWILDGMPARASNADVPEKLVGHARYLYGLRQEARDNAARLSRHAVQLRWPEGYLAKLSLAGRRCQLAHGALIQAFEALADASREYERGLGMALLGSGGGAGARTSSMPVRLLDESSAGVVAMLREVCERALTSAADACNLPVRSHTVFDTTWPVRRSEVASTGTDPYVGELRPMGWQGFGPQPLLHVDAR